MRRMKKTKETKDTHIDTDVARDQFTSLVKQAIREAQKRKRKKTEVSNLEYRADNTGKIRVIFTDGKNAAEKASETVSHDFYSFLSEGNSELNVQNSPGVYFLEIGEKDFVFLHKSLVEKGKGTKGSVKGIKINDAHIIWNAMLAAGCKPVSEFSTMVLEGVNNTKEPSVTSPSNSIPADKQQNPAAPPVVSDKENNSLVDDAEEQAASVTLSNDDSANNEDLPHPTVELLQPELVPADKQHNPAAPVVSDKENNPPVNNAEEPSVIPVNNPALSASSADDNKQKDLAPTAPADGENNILQEEEKSFTDKDDQPSSLPTITSDEEESPRANTGGEEEVKVLARNIVIPLDSADDPELAAPSSDSKLPSEANNTEGEEGAPNPNEDDLTTTQTYLPRSHIDPNQTASGRASPEMFSRQNNAEQKSTNHSEKEPVSKGRGLFGFRGKARYLFGFGGSMATLSGVTFITQGSLIALNIISLKSMLSLVGISVATVSSGAVIGTGVGLIALGLLAVGLGIYLLMKYHKSKGTENKGQGTVQCEIQATSDDNADQYIVNSRK